MGELDRVVERRWTIVYTSSSGKKLLVFRCLSISVAAASTDSVPPTYALLVPLKETENEPQSRDEDNFYLSQISALREEHDPYEPLRGAHVQQRRLDRLVPRRRLPNVRLGGRSKKGLIPLRSQPD